MLNSVKDNLNEVKNIKSKIFIVNNFIDNLLNKNISKTNDRQTINFSFHNHLYES